MSERTVTTGADGNKPSALKICGAVSKEKGFSKSSTKATAKNAQNRCLVPKHSVWAKNCGLGMRERVGNNKQKISPNLAKRTDFLVRKSQILVGVTGFEPAASTSQTSRATNCATPRKVKNIEFLRFFRKWSNMWSNRFSLRF